MLLLARIWGLSVPVTKLGLRTVITATIPIFVVVFAAPRLRQPVSPLQVLGLLAAFGGIGLVAFGDGADSTGVVQTTSGGVLLALVSALAAAFYCVWGSELTNDLGMAVVAAWSTLFGLLPLLPFAAWEMAHTCSQVPVEAALSALNLGVAVTAAGLFLWLWMLKQVPARMAASVQYLSPSSGWPPRPSWLATGWDCI